MNAHTAWNSHDYVGTTLCIYLYTGSQSWLVLLNPKNKGYWQKKSHFLSFYKANLNKCCYWERNKVKNPNLVTHTQPSVSRWYLISRLPKFHLNIKHVLKFSKIPKVNKVSLNHNKNLFCYMTPDKLQSSFQW